MGDVIQLLPDSVANQIAAGEVIQRPANVIKELMENSVDAGATTVSVLVEDAGRASIQVIDDGKGMSETDARLAFERHATSKIRKADDLFALSTMGFRGEALPSIAAVSSVTLRTRQDGDELGTELVLSASRVRSHKPCACPKGCNIKVENLFYNVPARRKFLKSNATELNNILAAFERIALAYPETHFTFHSNGGEVFNLRAGNVRQRISDIFGKKLSQSLLPVAADTTICRISGFVGQPESAKKKCGQQYFFVNGRFMKHPYFARAVQTAYERLVPQGEQVPYFLHFEVSPTDIDVNIHPAKTEIKFESEQAIWQILAAAVREAIGVFNEVPTIDFDTMGKPDIPSFDGHDAMLPKVTYSPGYNPFRDKQGGKDTTVDGWESLYPAARPAGSQSGGLFDSKLNLDTDKPQAEAAPTDCRQYMGQYLVTEVADGLMVVNQHRAHTRVLYEQYLKQMRERKASSQRLLFPEAVQFNPCDMAILSPIIDEMTAMGFELTPLGAFAYAINAVPAGLEGINPSTLVSDMVDDTVQASKSVKEDISHTLALSLARKAAIPQGQTLGKEEADNLLRKLFLCSNSNYTPEGAKTFIVIRQEEFEQRFA